MTFKRQVALVTITTVILLMGLALAGCDLKAPIDTADGSETTSDDQSYLDRYVNYPVSQLDIGPGQAEATATPLPSDMVVNAKAIDEVFVNVYERVNPAVVNIEVVDDNARADEITSSGSGFVYDLDGHIITNAHVVRDAREILVTFWTGMVADADIVGFDDFSDLAVIKVDVNRNDLVPVAIGNSGTVHVGQHVVAIGNPFGLQSSMTVGNVSATGRALSSDELININRASNGRFNNPSIIQVDASINPGNSGGPVLNLDGEVIGVATAIRTDTGIFQGVAFAVPANTVRRIVPQLIENGEATYSYLGISSRGNVTMPVLAAEFDLPVSQGVLISEVINDSPAETAGLRGGSTNEVVRGDIVTLGGDIIVAVDDLFIRNLDELLAYLVENTSPGDSVTLTVVRGDQTLEVPVILGERPR